MGYQAPVVLLAAIAFLALAYSWFGWRQKTINCCCPCLTLLLDNQESFLEGLLRQFLRWSYWHGTPWRLRVILYSPAQATIAILRHFHNLYPFDLEVTVDQEPPWRAGSEACRQGEGAIVDLREERDLPAAWSRIYRGYLKNNL